jgi:hypothetical protein
MTPNPAAALLLSTALAACGPTSPPSPPSPPSPSPGRATAPAQDHAMIDLVRDLAQFVTQRARSIDELTAHLGSAQPASDAAVHIAPSDARLRGVRIARYPDGAPFTIALELARPIAVAELTAAFGAYQTQERSEPGMPWPLMFHDAVRGAAARVSLLVEVAGPLAELDRHDARAVTLRIDPPAAP